MPITAEPLHAATTDADVPAIDPRPLRHQLGLAAVLAVVAAVALTLRLDGVHVPLLHYLPLHTVLEFASILAAFLVFATVWHTPAREVSASLFILASALFSAGWLDLFHALSFKGMPDLVTPSSVEKAIVFWLVARLTVAVTLLGVSRWPLLPPPGLRGRLAILALFAGMNLLSTWLVIFHEADLPRTFVEGRGLTPLKWWLEWLVTAVLVLAAWRLFRLSQRSAHPALPLLFGGAAVAALGELFLARYAEVNDIHNLLGHVYKVISYGLIYLALFAVTVRRPYQQLAQQTRSLLSANETLRMQAHALASTATPVLVSDLEGRMRWRNRASMAILPTRDALYERSLNLFTAPVTADPAQAQEMRATLSAGQTWRGPVQLENVQGQRLTLDRSVTPVRNADGVVEGYVSVAENVTQSLQARLRHQRVLETALDGFWIIDTQGRLLEANAAYARMSGYSVDELLQLRIHDLEAVEHHGDIQPHIERIMRTGYDRFETRHRHKLGHEFTVEVSVTYDPETGHLFVFSRDRSEREQAATVQRDLERQLQQAQKMQAMGQLTGGIAHDFNNILAAILGYANLALDRFVPDKGSKLAAYLREVIAASERARDLIAKMLSFTRTQPSAATSLVSPAAVVQEVVAMLRPSIPAGLQIRTRLEHAGLLRMDAGELNQVLVNLIINARDAIGELGSIDIVLHEVDASGEICAISQQRLSGHYLALDVSDSGSGIAPAHLSRLFDPFFTTKDVGKGTGLGLSVVQGIVRRAGGHVLVSSRPGQGSRFRLLFPLVRGVPALPGPAAVPEHAPSGTGQLVWVVDDEPAVARFVGDLLQGAGYRVRLFEEPFQVLHAVQDEGASADLLLTDQAMPGMSGLALAQHLQRLRPGLPVVLCSGYSDGLDASELAQGGVRRVLAKPVPHPLLLTVLRDELARGAAGAGPAAG